MSARPTLISVAAYKGGVGTTTTAACLAVELAERGATVLAADLTGTGDLARFFGKEMSPLSEATIHGGGSVFIANGRRLEGMAQVQREADIVRANFIVADVGTANRQYRAINGTEPDARVVVVRNDYYTLAATVRQTTEDDDILCYYNEDSALTLQDVGTVLGREPSLMFTVPLTAKLARRYDAGLLTSSETPLAGLASAIALGLDVEIEAP